MKKLHLSGFLLLAVGLLSGCGSSSSEPSPQEKRNNFDKCVLDYVASRAPFYNPDAREMAVHDGENNCRNLLG